MHKILCFHCTLTSVWLQLTKIWMAIFEAILSKYSYANTKKLRKLHNFCIIAPKMPKICVKNGEASCIAPLNLFGGFREDM